MDFFILIIAAATPILALVIFVNCHNDRNPNNSNFMDMLVTFAFIVVLASVIHSSYNNTSVLKSVGFISELIYIGLTAFLPAVLYMLFIIVFDKLKPEPFRYLFFSALIGGFAALIASFMGLEYKAGELMDSYSVAKITNIGFWKIAVPSEVIKWFSLLIFLKFNKYYDEYLDAVVYSVCLSMGFASIICVKYMAGFIGADCGTFIIQGLITALILIPVNLFAGTIMGYFLALAKYKNKILNFVFSLIIPVALYSLLVSVFWNWMPYIFVGIAILAVALYYKIRQLRALDIKNSSNIE